MIRRSTWIVLAVFIILISGVIILQRVERNRVDEVIDIPVLDTPKPVKSLIEFPKGESILGLIIRDAEKNVVDIQRHNESADWILVFPEGDADIERVNQIISQISSIQINSTLETDLELNVVGLDNPTYTMRLTLSSGKKLTAYIGDETIAGNSYYVRLAGGGPKVVSKYPVDQIINLLTMPPIMPTPISSAEPIEND